MVVTASTMFELGVSAPNFSLPDTQGNIVSLKDFKNAKAFLVMFMCNHCPFVKHVLRNLVSIVKDFQTKGVSVVGINSNDVTTVPEDRPDMMSRAAKDIGFTFPYLYDESQEVAKAYHAACTPDFFLFDAQRKLVYRGQMDDSRPGNNVPVTGEDLIAAVNSLLQGTKISEKQKPSMGCNIKWRSGNEPDYI